MKDHARARTEWILREMKEEGSNEARTQAHRHTRTHTDTQIATHRYIDIHRYIDTDTHTDTRIHIHRHTGLRPIEQSVKKSLSSEIIL